MSDPAPLAGPDLTQFIPKLEDGGRVLGHAFGQPVVVFRRGDDLLAIGATCTHYGGPLSEGLVDGDTVRCPWHHACFSLRTGEPLRAPALNPVACYEVGKRGWLPVIVGQKPPAPRPAAPSGAPASIVILGAGAAGSAAAEMLRRLGYEGPVTMIGDDPDPPYDRPNLSKDYLAGNAPEEWIPLRPREFWAEQRIDLLIGARAEAIDRAGKKVRLAGGKEIPYGVLILATGAEPIRLPVPGMDLPHVSVMRSLQDCRGIIERATKSKTAAVIGASFIGMEVAASLRARGLEVSVIAPETVPFERVLGLAIGNAILAVHRKQGVQFYLGRKPVRVLGSAVELDDGSRVNADLVVVGVGVRPRTALAAAAGLTVDSGVIVDAALRTSDPSIFAAGDIARYPDPRTGENIRVEHWVVAQRQGQTAAHSALGLQARFDSAPFFWTSQFGNTVHYVGHATSWDAIDVDGSPDAGDATLRYVKGGKTLAVATLGRDAASLGAELELERG